MTSAARHIAAPYAQVQLPATASRKLEDKMAQPLRFTQSAPHEPSCYMAHLVLCWLCCSIARCSPPRPATHTHTHTYTDWQTDRPTDRPTDGRTDRQTDRQTRITYIWRCAEHCDNNLNCLNLGPRVLDEIDTSLWTCLCVCACERVRASLMHVHGCWGSLPSFPFHPPRQ